MANTTTTKTVAWRYGENTIRAGTPLDTNGKCVNDSSAVGIVAEDLHMPDKTATIITAGTWDESVNAPYFHISDAVKLKLSNITFSNPPAIPLETILEDYVKETDLETTLGGYVTDTNLSTSLEDYVQKTDMATTEAAGIVLQGDAVADLESDPDASDFNGLLGVLREAGIIATPDESEEEPAET